MKSDNVLEEFGVSHHLFAEIGYFLSSSHPRISVREGSVIGSQYDGEIGGIPLSWRNVKDGGNGYYWTMAIVGMGWKLGCASSISPPSNEDYNGIMIHTSDGLRQRYIFRPKFEGDLDQMRKNLALVRMFID